MPSCAILYCSTTGNTRLACEYIAKRIPQVDFDLFDMRDISGFAPESYSFVGFCTYVDYQAPPRLFADTMSKIGAGKGKEAFLLLTCAAFPGNAIANMKRMAEKRGYNVVIGHTLHMPENYPPMRRMGRKFDDQPKEKDLDAFRHFIRDLGDMIVTKDLKGSVEPRKIKVGLINSMFNRKVRTDRLKKMGRKTLDKGICTRCGACGRACPYGAIRMQDGPIFDETRCNACFSCYNHCPVGAISSEKLQTADSRYPGPSDDLKKRMSY